MNIKQLEVFREIMKQGSISAAAVALHRTQPAISASLKSLEAQLGIALFQRQGRRLVAVPEAHYLLSEAIEILDRCSLAEQNLSLMGSSQAGTLHIACMPGPSAYLLPKFVSDYFVDMPKVKVKITARTSPQVANLMASQAYDVGICDLEAKTPHRSLFNVFDIDSECVCAISAEHPLSNKEVITVGDLGKEYMASLHEGVRLTRNTQEVFDTAGVAFNVRYATQYFLPIMDAVAGQQVCAIVDKYSARSYQIMQQGFGQQKVLFKPFAPAVNYSCSIITPVHRPLSQMSHAFVSAWRSYMLSTAQQTY
ncbi:MAG: LysR family transcriptional regulator [Gammaproteobacteria bacterium]|nr:LysR family transcriptional regulator [Gammaproteobacteria bacterium]MCP4881515.1 LysR family transcriptional regulator [Gammaproteobacteria bacterium]